MSHFVAKNGRKWPIFRNLSPDIFARNCSISKQTSVLRLFQCRLSNKCIKLPIANSSFFGAKFVMSFSRQKVAIPKTKNMRFVRMICSMFMENFVETG